VCVTHSRILIKMRMLLPCTGWQSETEDRDAAGGRPPSMLSSSLRSPDRKGRPQQGRLGVFQLPQTGPTGGNLRTVDSLRRQQFIVGGCQPKSAARVFAVVESAAGPAHLSERALSSSSHSIGPAVLVSIPRPHHFQPSLSGWHCISVCNSTSPTAIT
jgi:hypothetical protein